MTNVFFFFLLFFFFFSFFFVWVLALKGARLILQVLWLFPIGNTFKAPLRMQPREPENQYPELLFYKKGSYKWKAQNGVLWRWA